MRMLFLSAVVLLGLIVPLRSADDPTLETNPETRIDTTPSRTPLAPVPNANTVLTFHEEFKDDTLDTAKWNKWYSWPPIINKELQDYVPDAFELLPGGGLRIRAEKRLSHGQAYTSGALTTLGSFSQVYGYFEMKAKLPKGRGLWPAFWLLPPPETSKLHGGSEIDVMETLMHEPEIVHLTLHATDPATGKKAGKGFPWKGPDDLTQGYHLYALSWRPGDLVWLVDGVERFHISGKLVPSVPEYLLVNLAVGGSWPGAPDDKTVFPAYMDIAYIRAYQYKDLVPVSPQRFALGKATVTPEVVHAGESITVRLPLRADGLALPPMLARLYVTDYYGKDYRHETDVEIPAIPENGQAMIEGQCPVPTDFAPGTYTVSIKVECPTDKKLAGFVGIIYRFTVAP